MEGEKRYRSSSQGQEDYADHQERMQLSVSFFVSLFDGIH
jgi:hypothetical protein